LPALHLLSGLSHRLHVVLGQVEVGDKTNEIPCTLPLLAELVLEGRVIATDGLLTQDKIASQIVGKNGTT
jgi:predicted transposase YbfD/YdcC